MQTANNVALFILGAELAWLLAVLITIRFNNSFKNRKRWALKIGAISFAYYGAGFGLALLVNNLFFK